MNKTDFKIFIYTIKNINMNKFKESKYYMSKEHLINFINARIKGNKKIKELKNERIEDYNINPKLCINCKKPLLYSKQRNKFCCKSCAAIFNNKNRSDDFITEEFKEKQRNNAIKGFNKRKRDKGEISYYELEIKCPECGKPLTNEQKMRNRTYCSNSCRSKNISDDTRKKISDAIKERIKNGLHKGWSSRNIESYPETFFKKVLENNNIKYEFNKSVTKESLGLGGGYSYFLDFYIEDKNIDLEIDGAQHKFEERIESDEIRDNALINSGFIVYRIEWKNISTQKRKRIHKK